MGGSCRRERVVRFLAAQSPIRKSDIGRSGGGAPSDLTSAVMRRALLEHTEGVTVRLVRLIEALAVSRPHGKRCPNSRHIRTNRGFLLWTEDRRFDRQMDRTVDCRATGRSGQHPMRDCWLLRHRGRSDSSIAIGLTEALGPRLLAFPIARAHAYDAGDEHRCPFRGTPVDLGSKSDRNARCSAKDVSVLLCRGSLRTHCGCRSVNSDSYR